MYSVFHAFMFSLAMAIWDKTFAYIPFRNRSRIYPESEGKVVYAGKKVACECLGESERKHGLAFLG